MVYAELLAAGLASGFLAGLLGIGGGFVVVPVLMVLLPTFGVSHDIVPQVAVATSLAAMVPTAVSAVLTQHRRGCLDLALALRLAPGAAVGALIGTQLAKAVDGAWVAIFFAAYAGYFAIRMLQDATVAAPRRGVIARGVNAFPVPLVAAVIGGLSAVVGVGGASMTIPYLLATGLDMRRCVAVSSATGLAIAVAGASSFAFTSISSPAPLLGLVCWPAALTLGASAILMAPRGVAASHRLPVGHLKRAFGGVLVIVCAATLIKLAGSERPFAPADQRADLRTQVAARG